MKTEKPPHLGRLCQRLLKLGWPLAPTYHLENDEIKDLAFGSDRKLIAWAVSMKLNPPPKPLLVFDDALEIARAQQMFSDLVSDILRPSIKP